MPDIQKKFLYRVIDANFNRAREGLRVCEEFARFFLGDRTLTRDFKKIRNRVSCLYAGLPGETRKDLFAARDAYGDIGRRGFAFEKKRKGAADIFWASLQRSKEALRVLEEFSRLVGRACGRGDGFKELRFKLYDIEKACFKKMGAL